VVGPSVSLALLSSTSLISWKMLRRTVSPSLICGVTRSVTPTSSRAMFCEVWNGLFGSVVPVLVACRREVGTGMFSPTTISASSLSAVRIVGAEMMFSPLQRRRDQRWITGTSPVSRSAVGVTIVNAFREGVGAAGSETPGSGWRA
jgi:hypothetical protein